MVFVVFFDGNELRERMAPTDDGHVAAIRGRRDGEMTVVFQFGGKYICEGVFIESFAADERRRIDDVKLWNGQICVFRNGFFLP